MVTSRGWTLKKSLLSHFVSPSLQLHASAFVYEGAGCLIIGDSGSGKSTLIAEVLLRGASLIGDDQIILSAEHGELLAKPSPAIAGVLELRGLGLVQQPHLPTHPIHLIVQLVEGNDARLPEQATQLYCGIELPFIVAASPPKLSVAALLLYLKAVQEKRTLPPDWHPRG